MPAYKIILFYVQAPKATHASAPKKNTLGIVEQIQLLHKSAQQNNPDFSFTILTTLETPLAGLDFAYERVNCNIDPGALMRERNRVQLQYMEAQAHQQIPFILLDTDILLNIDPTTLFVEPYDIGLTWRANDDMPINGGVVLVSNRNPEASKAFYRCLYTNQINDPMELAHWFGEQRSMAKIVGLTPKQLAQTTALTKDGVNYRLFPCATHNHTPRYLEVFGRKQILAPCIFHFKGSTARFMAQFWRYHLDTNSGQIPFRVLRLLVERIKLRYQRVMEKAAR